MKSRPSRVVLSAVFGVSLTLLSAPAGAQVVDNFQSYAVGALPGPLWLDAGAVLPTGRIPSFPSGYVFNTTDAHGNPTKAVTTVSDLATSKGIFTPVPISTLYSLHADVRVDQYSDAPDNTTGDWAMELTFGQNGVSNWAFAPSVGIYASSLTKGWRIFLNTAGSAADIDLGVAATLGTWYTVSQDFDVLLGRFHSRIADGATGAMLVDQFDTISGWNPADAQFDSFAFVGGELGVNDTIGNIGVVDNVNVVATTTPEPNTSVLLGSGVIPLIGFLRRRRTRA